MRPNSESFDGISDLEALNPIKFISNGQSTTILQCINFQLNTLNISTTDENLRYPRHQYTHQPPPAPCILHRCDANNGAMHPPSGQYCTHIKSIITIV